MKKIIIASVLMIVSLSVSAGAADLNFTPEGGGRWIYCNNPEGIRNEDLMNADGCEPSYIMNNAHLTPDTYDFLMCHINSTNTNDGYGAGFDIELDVEITAEEDSEITINKSFFETPKTESYLYGDGTWAKEMHKVGCLNSLASFLGVNLCERNGSWLYEAKDYESVTLEIKKGETIWLGEYTDGYEAIPYEKPAQFIGEFELTKGRISFNVAAFASGAEIGDRSGFDPKAKFGKYSYTRTQKGIADTLPKVNTYLEYTIDNTFADGDYITNKVFNQYKRDGFVTDVWCSHLNPQDDIWSKNIAAESDLLTFEYEDDSKLEYYGKRVKNTKRTNVWTWDPFHSDTTHYEGEVTWFQNADEYYPNYELSPYRSNQGYACSMGNYCVTESYNLKVKNTTPKDKYFEYVAKTSSNIAVYVEDEDGKHSGFVKGEWDGELKDPLASVKIPAKGEKEFSINVILPINYVGGIKNMFCVRDESSIEKTYEDFAAENESPEKGPDKSPDIEKCGVSADSVYDKLSDEVQKLIGSNAEHYEIIKTGFGYVMRYDDWDGIPYYFYNHWGRVKDMYVLDDKYGLKGHYTPDFLTRLALAYDGDYYREDAEGKRYVTSDGFEWEAYNHRLPLPEVTFDKKNTPSDWAVSEVKRAYEIDAAPYDLKDQLNYTAPMTREIFCYVLSSMLELAEEMPSEIDKRVRFSDTESSTVRKMATAGIISGYDDGTFRPKNSITREEAAVLLDRTMKYVKDPDALFATPMPTFTPKPTITPMPTETPSVEPSDGEEEDLDAESGEEGVGVNDSALYPKRTPLPIRTDSVRENEEYKYADHEQIGAWAADAVYGMNKEGIMFGVGSDNFAPKMTYTNEQSIATILRLYDALKK